VGFAANDNESETFSKDRNTSLNDTADDKESPEIRNDRV
jgi:hypothetical protein